ncbi:MAG: hypothetical protein BGO94_11625 [Micrococcales bacterium 72-143]|nr:MAG: hypothetical protein BGO94_11625 [Micrococcales bacterium 72-143]
MRRLLSVVVLLGAAALLSSCALLPGRVGLRDDDYGKAEARMVQIADALKSHDAAALKGMFSPYALDRATAIDEGLDYVLSFFPSGEITWQENTVNSKDAASHGKKSELLLAYYKVSASGNDYWLYFADFTVNDVVNPENVGIYALGVASWVEDTRSPEVEPFFRWAAAVDLEGSGTDGYPGIWVPPAS